MVSFTCNACNETVKKNQVEKHYRTVCPSCSVLSCIDCGKDFHGDAYSSHTSCITEAEKYQGNLYRPKEKANKGDAKQQEWMKQVHEASETALDPKLKLYLSKITEYSNVPRKKAKFINFCRNSLRVYDQQILERIWDVFEGQKGNQNKSEVTKPNGKKQDAINGTEHEQNESSQKNEINEFLLNNQNGYANDVKEKLSKKKRKRKRDDPTNGLEVKLENENEDFEKQVKNNGKKDKKKKKLTTNEECELNDHETLKKSKKEKKQCKELENGLNSNSNQGNQDENDGDQDGCRGKFNWQKTIKLIIKDAGEDGISMKKLQKKALSAYQTHGVNHQARSNEESCAIFKKKLLKYPKAKIIKDRVFYKS